MNIWTKRSKGLAGRAKECRPAARTLRGCPPRGRRPPQRGRPRSGEHGFGLVRSRRPAFLLLYSWTAFRGTRIRTSAAPAGTLRHPRQLLRLPEVPRVCSLWERAVSDAADAACGAPTLPRGAGAALERLVGHGAKPAQRVPEWQAAQLEGAPNGPQVAASWRNGPLRAELAGITNGSQAPGLDRLQEAKLPAHDGMAVQSLHS